MALGFSGYSPAHAAKTVGIFDYFETKRTGLTAFKKWTAALERYRNERRKAEGGCEKTTFNRCHYKRWSAFIESVRKEKPKRILKKVNDFMNKSRYILDPINWGVADYWESPGQFFYKFGDCEDYAITKYLSLKALGWNIEDMRIVVLQDMNLRIMHAILVVYMDGKAFVLDNQISIVVDASKIRHYRPIYSVNETSWWRHTPKNKGRRVNHRRPLRRR